MLTKEQEVVLQEACELYIKAREEKELAPSLELFNQAFGMLIEYIDEVDDVYYRLVFANCIEELQRKGKIEFSSVILQAKVDIYLKTLRWFLETPQYKKYFEGHLLIGFDALARMFLLGEDNVKQSDHNACICYQCIQMFNSIFADLYLRDFVKDEVTDQWKFVGVRPQ